jgi:uncharacterized protein (TIGR01777 family)
MKVLVSGASGLIGSHLVADLDAAGHQVVRLTRSAAGLAEAEIHWDPDGGRLDREALQGMDAVVHLAGENIAAGRWTPARKARIRDSRLRGTRLLCEALAGLEHPPRVLVSASAVGYYGDRGEERLTEESAAGEGFLPELCRAWEAATEPAARAGVRVVHARLGMVLSPRGGALAKMLPIFRLGLGGRLGGGRQYVSWIDIGDVVGAIVHALGDDSLRGPVNVVAPQAVTNAHLTKVLGRVLRRPTVLPAPAFALRLVLGEMADALLLASARVEPRRLLAAGYAFRHPNLEECLRRLLHGNQGSQRS